MIESKNDAGRNLEKVLQALEQMKQRVANEKRKQNENKCKDENYHKYIMGFRTKDGCITDNRAGLSGGRKKFNVNFIVTADVFLYN